MLSSSVKDPVARRHRVAAVVLVMQTGYAASCRLACVQHVSHHDCAPMDSACAQRLTLFVRAHERRQSAAAGASSGRMCPPYTDISQIVGAGSPCLAQLVHGIGYRLHLSIDTRHGCSHRSDQNRHHIVAQTS